jgi:hypothetical protein
VGQFFTFAGTIQSERSCQIIQVHINAFTSQSHQIAGNFLSVLDFFFFIKELFSTIVTVRMSDIDKRFTPLNRSTVLRSISQLDQENKNT